MKNKLFEELDARVNKGYLRKVISPCGKLVLYNHTDKCTYEKAWDEYTLNARGTVYEIESGNVIARAFPKFFNYGELDESRRAKLLKETDFQVYDKLDGSLGILYYYDGAWRVNTRGSFTSDQAIKATEMLSKYQLFNRYSHLTFLVEIIYPANKIIVDYGDEEKLVLLGVYETNSGCDMTPEMDDLLMHARAINMEYAAPYECSNISQLIKIQGTIDKNIEGFVVRFKGGYRCKFKGEEYLKIARVLSSCTALEFWRNMENGKVNKSFLEAIPEELLPELDHYREELEFNYENLYADILAHCRNFITIIHDTIEEDSIRKAMGMNLKQCKYGSLAFSYLDKKHDAIDKAIMKMIRPKGNEL